jgi:hypothetical protein
MRKLWISAAFVAGTLLGGAAIAADFGCNAPSECGCNACADECCDGCGGLFGHHRHGHHRYRYDGLQPGFNCGCNGSYKFPVPPLYTYHWPGMWSAQQMTGYQSPWRFPPLKPYVDEVAPQTMSVESLRRVRPVSAADPVEADRPISFSRHVERLSR